MADFIPENLTEDQVIALLQMLFKNLNNLDSVYYDMFINPIPMDITLDRYDENGTLQKIVLPNRAKDRITVLSGSGSPEGVVEGNIGSFYVDTRGRSIYYKTTSTSYTGWAEILSKYNMKEGIDYLSPSGDGHELRNLSGSSIEGGLVSPEFGGTGASNLYGIIRGNGILPCTVAEPEVDYVTPSGMTGMIAFFANVTAPTGWLIADGSVKRQEDYPALALYLGATESTQGIYDNGTEIVGEEFRLPDLRGIFVRGLDLGRGYDTNRTIGTNQLDSIKKHTHNVQVTTTSTGKHAGATYPCRWNDGDSAYRTVNPPLTSETGDNETRPLNIALLPCIKY